MCMWGFHSRIVVSVASGELQIELKWSQRKFEIASQRLSVVALDILSSTSTTISLEVQ